MSRPARSTLWDGWWLAWGLLTVLPVPGHRTDRRSAAIAMVSAPMVGAGLGLVAAAASAGVAALGVGPFPAAVAAVTTLALTTRGLHLDGLADTVDGLGSGRPAHEALEVMRRGDVGPFGVVAVVLTLLAQVGLVASAWATGRGLAALVLAAVAGRLALVLATWRGVPAARPDGLGRLVASVLPGPVVVIEVLVVVGVATAVGLLAGVHGPGALGAALALVAAVAVSAAGVARVRRRLGGVTGDTLGALVELATTAALLVLATAH
ncbi:MAG: adenosylcobinamide-GDP ribazoletransferase [Actinomycetes bacterium]